MRNTTIALLAGLATLATPLAAQTQYNQRVVDAMKTQGKYQAPLCPLTGGDFHTGSAGTYLKTAVEGFNDDKAGHSQVSAATYTTGVKKALQTSLDAVTANPNNAAGWYYVGRSDLLLGDLVGADSALTRLEKLSPDCAESDIKSMRQKAWLVLVGPSSEFIRLGQNDSALAILRAANTISRYYPQGYYNLGATFVNLKMNDSAIVYFKIAQDKSAADPQFAETLKNSTFNLAYLYQQTGDATNAIAQQRKYLTLDPNNNDVKRALAGALRVAGKADEAAQIEGQMMASGAMTAAELSSSGVRAFNNKDYAGAVDAFQKALTLDPMNHDAMFNLAQSYRAQSDGKNLIVTANKLLEIDPLGISNFKLLLNGYVLTADQQKQIDVVTQMQAIPTGVAVSGFALRKDGAKLSGEATGNEAVTASGKTIPPAAITVVFEFLDAKGAVVASQEVAIPALAPNVKQDISVDVSGAGITAWRYHKK